MTRETKIGLLVGLGFIVVFAVLLSNNNPAPPSEKSLVNLAQRTASETLPLGQGTVELENTFARGRAEATINDVSGTLSSRSAEVVDQLVSAYELDDIIRLPVVDLLEQPTTVVRNTTLEAVTGSLLEEPALPTVVDARVRMAPPIPLSERTIPDPQPTEREPQPRKSPDLTPETEGPSGTASLKEYVVQRGDTLWKIAKGEYNSSKTAVVEHIVQANASIIKDKNTLVVGQKIVLPQLPSDLFEPVVSVNVSGSGDRLVRMDDLLHGTSSGSERRAPLDYKLVETDGTKARTDTGAVVADNSVKPAYQEYVIQPRDTFTNIAERQLGSGKYWTEIKKLNPNVDPTRMVPGTKIKLPSKRSLSQTSDVQRASA
ncbi:MAG: LysM peptidoglycan-binding domain-containing protein [Phycisphaerales bacterium]|nr:LysM peptidoglycan-binding domain-containing protein [Phycisphaerales bacterium]